MLSVGLYIIVPVVVAQLYRRWLLANGGMVAMKRALAILQPLSIAALLLTLVPFALVHWAGLPRSALLIVIGAFALVQMVVHFRFFLHIGFRQKREDLQLILFSTLLLIIMVGGTIWIMFSLAQRMTMPMLP